MLLRALAKRNVMLKRRVSHPFLNWMLFVTLWCVLSLIIDGIWFRCFNNIPLFLIISSSWCGECSFLHRCFCNSCHSLYLSSHVVCLTSSCRSKSAFSVPSGWKWIHRVCSGQAWLQYGEEAAIAMKWCTFPVIPRHRFWTTLSIRCWQFQRFLLQFDGISLNWWLLLSMRFMRRFNSFHGNRLVFWRSCWKRSRLVNCFTHTAMYIFSTALRIGSKCEVEGIVAILDSILSVEQVLHIQAIHLNCCATPQIWIIDESIPTTLQEELLFALKDHSLQAIPVYLNRWGDWGE